MDPHQYCRQKVIASGTSFYYSFLFLSPEKREAIIALYAYCREIDDIVDESTDTGLARMQIQFWRSEVDRLFAGDAQHPISLALADIVAPFNITKTQLITVIDGMLMDLDYNRYPDFATLETYCYRVAGIVGEMSAQIFGFTERRTLDYAKQLGLALQLTNIIRDVGEDARRNRIYLPLDELDQAGISTAQIIHGSAQDQPAFRNLMRRQADRALATYAQAYDKLPKDDRKPQLPGLIMGAIYHAQLNEIIRDNFRVLTHRTRLTPLRKLWIAYTTWFRG